MLAEDAGFDSFLTWDHYTLPWGDKTFEPWILLAYLAAQTSRIRLGTVVTPIPLRPPAILAKMVTTLDQLSRGRAILGVGAGWHRPEFDGYSVWSDNRTRVAKTREGVQLILRLWQEKQVDFQGQFYTARRAVLEPKPVQQPHPPLWFGTRGEYMMRLAARFGDGWIPIHVSASEYRKGVAKIQQHAREMGVNRRFTFVFDADPHGSVEEYLREIDAYRGAGCEIYGVAWEYPRNNFLERIKWFAKEVMSSFT